MNHRLLRRIVFIQLKGKMATNRTVLRAPSTVRETITPEAAREYLKANYDNRAVRGSWVEELVGKIQRNQWEFTHQGIAFDVTGRLVDGQHRLMAIARAGIPCDVLVTRNLSDSVFRYIDAGKIRSLADRIHLTDAGAKMNEIAVSIMRAYVLATTGKSPPPQELIENEFLKMTDEVLEVASVFINRKRYITTGGIGAAIACYATVHPTEARDFMRSLISGSSLEAGSPILTLREAALNCRLGPTNTTEQYWKTMQATRFFHEKRPLTRISTALEDWRGNRPKRLLQAKISATRRGVETVRRAGG